jgi:hypothetical protein
MIGFLFKNWKLFLDIILVVGGILAFTFFDPLGIFNNTKLQSTANMVSGVKDIGQLVTAEYYGEVISSWKEFKLTEFPEDTISYKAEQLYTELKIATSEVDIKFRNFYKKEFGDDYKDKYGKEFYYKFLAFLAKEQIGLNVDKVFDEKDSDLKRNYEKKIIEFMYDDSKNFYKSLEKKYKKQADSLVDNDFANYLSEVPGFVNDFYDYYGFLTKKHIESGSNKRKEIVFIGRGWVKAGFDFGKLNEGNFMYDESNKSVHFFGIKPEVLDTDINPWFIPERKVKGFELVDYSGKVSFEDAKAVKKQCKEKLLDQANRADIIKKALENGEEALKNFFALILDEPDIKVKFHTHPFDLHYAMIMADTLIDINEALFIQSLYQSEMEKWNSPGSDEERSMLEKRQQLFWHFIKQLKELNFIDSAYRFNFYSMAAANILSDTFNISLDDRDTLIALRDTLMPTVDSLNLTTNIVSQHPGWFGEGDFRYDFNHTMELLENEAIMYEVDDTCELWNETLKRNRYQLYLNGKFMEGLKNKLVVNGDTSDFISCNGNVDQSNFFENIQYDMNYTLVLDDTIERADTIDSILTRYENKRSYSNQLDSLNRNEMQAIIAVEQKQVIARNKRNPVQDLRAGVEGFIDKIKKKH